MTIPTVTIPAAENEEIRAAVKAHLNDLTKPPGSLGRLEELAMRYCLCRGDAGAKIEKKTLHVFAGDHGITAEGVAPYPKEVTRQMVMNMVADGAAVTVMCRQAGVDYKVVDMGVEGEFPAHDLLLNKKTGPGTKSFLAGPAMTEDECVQALQAGMDIAAGQECSVTAVGEMGIGNTSPASALTALLLDIPGRETVGMGTGATGGLLETKRDVIDRAVAYHKKEWDGTAADALRRVGGFEIAGMCGYLLGCAAKRTPVMVDGFIATAAALCAVKIDPAVKDYLFFGHVSDEQFHKNVLESIGVRPLLQLGMRLGEGTGAVLAMQLLEQAMNCYHSMATFSSAGVSNKDD